MKYRHHRGSLEASLETVIEIHSLDELKKVLMKDRKAQQFSDEVGELTCKHYCYDERIKWNTWLICEDGNAIGFSDGELLGG